MAAWGAATVRERALRVAVLEKMPRPARKLMLTGKGRCNFTNAKDWEDFQPHIHPNPRFLRPAFFNLPPEKLRKLLEDNGLPSVVERGDRVFPASRQAVDVVDCLERMVRQAGVELLCGKEVKTVERSKNAYCLTCADGSRQECGRLIIATGGLSYPTTGSTGDGYVWAREAGLEVKPTFPSLTALVPKGYKVIPEGPGKGLRHIGRELPLSPLGKSLCGISLKNICLSVFIDGQLSCSEQGDLDFTDGGIEGPTGFRVSRKCVCALNNASRIRLEIDLKPGIDERRLSEKGLDLHRMLPKDIARGFLASSFPGSPQPDAAGLARALKHWSFDIAGYVGYERCVITAGGVSLGDVSAKTLSAKGAEGLYLAGEVLDLDADTGGYNLHIAFSTGLLAGQSAALSALSL